jgi:hypothetical protein
MSLIMTAVDDVGGLEMAKHLIKLILLPFCGWVVGGFGWSEPGDELLLYVALVPHNEMAHEYSILLRSLLIIIICRITQQTNYDHSCSPAEAQDESQKGIDNIDDGSSSSSRRFLSWIRTLTMAEVFRIFLDSFQISRPLSPW